MDCNLGENTKPIALALALVLFSSGLGYTSMAAYGQVNQPCSVSHPCTKICGDHPCAAGETWTLSGNKTTVMTGMNKTNTNQTAYGISGMGIMNSVNVTKTKSNMTMINPVNVTKTKSNMTMIMSYTNATRKITEEKTPPKETGQEKIKPVKNPKEQVASGIKPKDVQCQSGFELMINKFNSKPACVKPDIASLLVSRGWGTLEKATSH